MAFILIEHATSPLTIAASTSASFVQAAASAASGTATTLSLAFPSNTQAGDLLLVAFDYDTKATPTSVTDSQGNVFTEVGSQLESPAEVRSRVYYAKNIKGGADMVTVTLSTSSSYLELYLNEYSGINTTNPIDAEVGASGSAGTASSGDATTTVAGDIIYGYCVGDEFCKVGPGFTARSTLDANLVEDMVAGSAGSYAATGSANSGWTMQMVALKPASAVMPPAITSVLTTSGTTGKAFSYQITATNAPTSYGAIGLPAGLSVNSGTGLISGTPTTAGSSTVSLSATNAAGTGNATLTVTVAAAVPPAFVQAAASAASGTATTLSLAFPSNTQAGDLLLVAFDYDTNATPTSVADSQGNVFTEVGSQLESPAEVRSRVYYAKNIKGGADMVTVTLSTSSSYLELYLNEYSGINTTNPIDAEVGASGSAGTASSGDATTTVAGDIIYGYCVGDEFCKVGPGFTARSTLDANLVEDMVAGSAGSYAATGSANSGWTMQMVALKPASASTNSAPGVSLSSSSLSFGSEAVGVSSTAQTITLGNTGSAALSITSVVIAGADSSDFSQTNNCGATVGAGANCTISVTFTPAASGSLSAALTVTDNASASPQSVSLTGTGTTTGGGTSPAVSLSPTGLSFGNQPVGVASPSQTITLSNTGNAALSITGLALAGANPSDFAQSNNCGASVAAGGNCTISVTFTPAANGSFTAAVSVADNASGSPQTITLSGTGASPGASLSPSSLSFGNQPVGVASPSQTITLSNTGNAALSITGLALAGANPSDFAQSNNCGASVAAGGNCTISVTFTPAASGSFTAAVSVADNASGSPQTVTLSGTGASPGASLSPSSLSFGNEPVGVVSPSQTITLSNTGNAALSITGLALAGANPSDFAQSNNCGASVAAGGNCTISVTFTPAASGSFTAAVSVADNASGSPQTVTLSGTGASPGVSLSPSSLAFGSVPIDSVSSLQTISLSNTGNAVLSITSLAVGGANSGDFAETADTCGSSVVAGGNCTIGVTFTPSLAGAETASITVTDNAGGSPQTVALSGTGIHDVILTWTASATSGVAGYNVYRGTSSGGESSTPLNPTLITGTTLTDSNVLAGQAYYYVVAAVADGGTEQSPCSSEVSATVP
jgi:hypothetical protein